jgi:hypothetical protein
MNTLIDISRYYMLGRTRYSIANGKNLEGINIPVPVIDDLSWEENKRARNSMLY